MALPKDRRLYPRILHVAFLVAPQVQWEGEVLLPVGQGEGYTWDQTLTNPDVNHNTVQKPSVGTGMEERARGRSPRAVADLAPRRSFLQKAKHVTQELRESNLAGFVGSFLIGQ